MFVGVMKLKQIKKNVWTLKNWKKEENKTKGSKCKFDWVTHKDDWIHFEKNFGFK